MTTTVRITGLPRSGKTTIIQYRVLGIEIHRSDSRSETTVPAVAIADMKLLGSGN